MNAPPTAPQFYIPATASLLERRPRTLKHGDTFAMFDHYGDLTGGVSDPEGLYHQDTRFLSLVRLEIEGRRPLLLSSTVHNNNALMTADLTNPDVYSGAELLLARDSVHLLRSKFLWQAACYEAIVAHNYSNETRTVTISVDFDADFRDVFEVRGDVRPQRGDLVKEVRGRDRVVLRYTGLDQRVRETRLVFDPPPSRLTEQHAEWRTTLAPGERRPIFFTASCDAGAQPDCRFLANFRRAHRARIGAHRTQARVVTSNELFNEVLSRALADLVMLVTETPHGPYPYAGIPWFATAFGRDGIITAIEMLPFDPGLARGVLSLLAVMQARETDAARDEEPGKILHEMRQGEMAVLGEIPFGRYYGSVDSTPLFVVLAGLYWQRTGDAATLRWLWPNIRAALEWIDRYGDLDGDGLVEYLRKSENGLANQGWKDSDDSVFHENGELAQGSIALCEVQGYVYAAKMHASVLARDFGEPALAQRLGAEAEVLRQRFEERFWMEDMGFYALALDGAKQPCRVLASNAGHALFSGIAAADRADRVARRLVSSVMFSGWGIRTVAQGEARYNPMGYHNGSIWPHDNALIALGLARYGHARPALQVLTAMFDAAIHMDLRRLPELFCGFRRKPDRGPTFYPVACAPQAWASAAPFAMLAAALGLEVHAGRQKVYFRQPHLPDFLYHVELLDIPVGDSRIDVRLARRGDNVSVTVLRKSGPANVEVHL